MTALGWTLAILGGLIVGMVLASMLLFRKAIADLEMQAAA